MYNMVLFCLECCFSCFQPKISCFNIKNINNSCTSLCLA